MTDICGSEVVRLSSLRPRKVDTVADGDGLGEEAEKGAFVILIIGLEACSLGGDELPEGTCGPLALPEAP